MVIEYPRLEILFILEWRASICIKWHLQNTSSYTALHIVYKLSNMPNARH